MVLGSFVWLMLFSCQPEATETARLPPPIAEPRVRAPGDLPPRWRAPCVPGLIAARIGRDGFSTLGDALASSVPGDTVEVCPGEHPGSHLVWHAGPLRIVGLGATPEETTLDGRGAGAILDFHPWGVQLEVENLQFRLGYRTSGGSAGGAINVHGDTSGGSLIIRRCIFIENTQDISTNDSDLYIEDSIFQYSSGSAVQVAAAHFRDTSVVIRRSTFTNLEGFAVGASIITNVPDITFNLIFEDSSITDSHSPRNFFAMNGNASWITDIRRSSFLRNRSEWGVMTISDKDSNFHAFSISDSEFSDNETINASIVNLEARNRRFFTTISNTTFNRNISSNPPWGEGGVIEMDPEVVLTLDNVAFGTGADANYHYDISPCNPGLGVVSGTLRGHPQNQLTCP